MTHDQFNRFKNIVNSKGETMKDVLNLMVRQYLTSENDRDRANILDMECDEAIEWTKFKRQLSLDSRK